MIDRDKTHLRRFYNVPSGTKWVHVLYCPKDLSDDLTPMFPVGSKFPLNQFMDSLRYGVWPEGMVVRVTLLGYTQDEKRKRIEKKMKYTVPRRDRQTGLKWKMEEDHRRFMNRVGNEE